MGSCGNGDLLGFADNPEIRSAQKVLKIQPGLVRFVGCDDGRFSVVEEPGSQTGTAKYRITYPAGAKSEFLAPITHELSHVMQSELAGGLRKLQGGLESRRIELGADFITGMVFSLAFDGRNLGEFQHNLSLIGLYREPTEKAHGSPIQRTYAFRRGVFFNFKSVSSSFPKASGEFQANIYGEIPDSP